MQSHFNAIQLIHVKREQNAAADYVTSRPLHGGTTFVVEDPAELQQLLDLSELHLLVECKPDIPDPVQIPSSPGTSADGEDPAVSFEARTRIQAVRNAPEPGVTESDSANKRMSRIRQLQCELPGLQLLIQFLRGDLTDMSRHEVCKTAKVADQYVLNSDDTLPYV